MEKEIRESKTMPQKNQELSQAQKPGDGLKKSEDNRFTNKTRDDTTDSDEGKPERDQDQTTGSGANPGRTFNTNVR